MACDRRPGSEAIGVAAEGADVLGDMQPCLRRDVFGLLADQGLKEAQDPGLKLAV